MIFLEAAIILLAFCLLINAPKRITTSVLYGVLPLVLALVLHYLISGIRWQMNLAYGFAFLALFYCAIRWRFPQLNIPKPLRWLNAALSAVLAFIVFIPPFVLHKPTLNEPTGQYTVGAQTFQFTDEARTELDIIATNQPRKLLTRVWYPAANKQADQKLPYMSEAEARALGSNMRSVGDSGAEYLFSHLADIETAAKANAQPLNDKFPVLVFSHGFSGTLNQSTSIIQDIVSHGFIVVAVGHPGGASVLEFPDGTLVNLAEVDLAESMVGDEALQLVNMMQTETDYKEFVKVLTTILDKTGMLEPFSHQWSADQSFVIDQIFEGGFGNISEHMDITKLGVFGHSFGGSASALTFARDKRVHAAVNVDGMQYGGLLGENLREPFLMLYTDHPNNGVLYNDIMYRDNPETDTPFDAIVLKNSNHHDATDLTFLIRPSIKAVLPPNPLIGNIPGEEASYTISAAVRLYFKAQFENDPSLFDNLLNETPTLALHRPQFTD